MSSEWMEYCSEDGKQEPGYLDKDTYLLEKIGWIFIAIHGLMIW